MPLFSDCAPKVTFDVRGALGDDDELVRALLLERRDEPLDVGAQGEEALRHRDAAFNCRRIQRRVTRSIRC